MASSTTVFLPSSTSSPVSAAGAGDALDGERMSTSTKPDSARLSPGSPGSDGILSAASSSAPRLVDIGCFILRGESLLIADPLAVGDCLNNLSHLASMKDQEEEARQNATMEMKKMGKAAGIDSTQRQSTPPLPSGSLVVDHTAQGLWGVLAVLERFNPSGSTALSGGALYPTAVGGEGYLSSSFSSSSPSVISPDSFTENGAPPMSSSVYQNSHACTLPPNSHPHHPNTNLPPNLVSSSSLYSFLPSQQEQDQPQPFHSQISPGGAGIGGGEENSNSVVSTLYLLNGAHMQMEQAELNLLKALPWEILPGAIQITCGQVGVFTKQSMIDTQESLKRCYSFSSSTGQKTLLEECEKISYWYNRACELTCSEHQVGILDVVGGPVGCVSATGLAEEGTYKVHVLRSHDTDDVWAMKIDFLQQNPTTSTS